MQQDKTKLFENLNQFLSVEDVAGCLSVSPKTVYGWIYRGYLPSFKLGPRLVRIRKKDIEKWISR